MSVGSELCALKYSFCVNIIADCNVSSTALHNQECNMLNSGLKQFLKNFPYNNSLALLLLEKK